MGVGAELVLVEGVFLELVEVGIEALRLVRVPVFGVVRIPEPMDRGTGCFASAEAVKCRVGFGKGLFAIPQCDGSVLR